MEIAPLSLIMLSIIIKIKMTIEFDKFSHIYMKCYRHEKKKYCREQPNIQQCRMLSANEKMQSVFLNTHFSVIFVCFVYFVYSFNIFHFM